MRIVNICTILCITVAVLAGAAGLRAAESEPDAAAIQAELRACPHKILFEAYADDNWELFVMNADGSGVKNITKTRDVHELYPQASPDGRKICCLSDVEKGGDTVRGIFLMNQDGTDRKQVAQKGREPCWSPDGKQIAYLAHEFDTFKIEDFASKGIRFYNVASGKTTEHPNANLHHLYNPTWSADGQWIVSTVHGGMGFKHAILAIAVDGPRVYELKIPGCRPCLSPDGRRVTWSRDDHTICVADVKLSAEGAPAFNVKVVARDAKLHLYHPDFSPDGKYITFSMGPGGRMPKKGPGTHVQVAEMIGVCGPWDLYLRRADCTGPVIQLTQDASRSNKESEWLPAGTP
jgi:Tol biopolymer transport system component